MKKLTVLILLLVLLCTLTACKHGESGTADDNTIVSGSYSDSLNGIVYRLLPYAYRVWQVPSELYDGMIFVTEAHPISARNRYRHPSFAEQGNPGG